MWKKKGYEITVQENGTSWAGVRVAPTRHLEMLAGSRRPRGSLPFLVLRKPFVLQFYEHVACSMCKLGAGTSPLSTEGTVEEIANCMHENSLSVERYRLGEAAFQNFLLFLRFSQIT